MVHPAQLGFFFGLLKTQYIMYYTLIFIFKNIDYLTCVFITGAIIHSSITTRDLLIHSEVSLRDFLKCTSVLFLLSLSYSRSKNNCILIQITLFSTKLNDSVVVKRVIIYLHRSDPEKTNTYI